MEINELQNSVFEGLKGAAKACQDLSQYVLRAGNHLRLGEIQEGNDLLLGILDDFGQLIAFLEDVTQCQDVSEVLRKMATDTISAESNATVDILQMAYEAQENQDWVYLADVLEYELSEKLDSWNVIFKELCKVHAANMAA